MITLTNKRDSSMALYLGFHGTITRLKGGLNEASTALHWSFSNAPMVLQRSLAVLQGCFNGSSMALYRHFNLKELWYSYILKAYAPATF